MVRLPLPFANLVKQIRDGVLKGGDVAAFYGVDHQAPAMAVPLMSASAACGFPSPAEDYIEGPLNFNELLIANPAATFAVRAAGESMIGAGIFPGDVVVIDRSRQPVSGDIILACLDNEFTIKRYRRTTKSIVLKAENQAFSDIVVTEEREFAVVGRGHALHSHVLARPWLIRRLPWWIATTSMRHASDCFSPN